MKDSSKIILPSTENARVWEVDRLGRKWIGRV
jgi:hypothetical protein